MIQCKTFLFALTISVLLCSLSISTYAVTQQKFYVSPSGDDSNTGTAAFPFKTLTKARDAVRTEKAGGMTGDIIVELADGVYPLISSFSLTDLDSGQNDNARVIYQAETGATPIISGGELVTGWVPAGDDVYYANVGTKRFRQLYVNENYAIRAREPDVGSYERIIQWDTINGIDQPRIDASLIENWNNLGQVEMVIQRQWEQTRLRISNFTITDDTASILGKSPEANRNTSLGNPLNRDGQGFHFENAFEFLDEPGEWYLNTTEQRLYYKQQNGEDMSTAEVYIPQLEKLVDIDGANYVTFKGLRFQHSNWLFPDSKGYVGIQSNRHFDPFERSVPGAVTIQNATAVNFIENTFQHLGGSGLTLVKSTDGCLIEGNVLKDIAGTGLWIYANIQDSSSESLRSKNDIIRNNYVTRIGKDYFGASGIRITASKDLLVEHNEVYDCPYTGISINHPASNPEPKSENIIVQYNYVHKVMTLLNDGAGIYHYNPSISSIIRYNLITNVLRSEWPVDGFPTSGIYIDNGSENVLVDTNVIRKTGAFVHVNVKTVDVTDNTIINNLQESVRIEALAGLKPAYASIGSQIPPPPAPTRTVNLNDYSLRWDLNELGGTIAKDASLNDNDGTLIGEAYFDSGSIALDGSGDYISAPDHISLNPLEGVTVAVQMKRSSVSTTNVPGVLEKRGQYRVIGTGRSSPESRISFGIKIAGDTTFWKSEETYHEYSNDTWHHVIGIYDGRSVHIFVDGVFDGSAEVIGGGQLNITSNNFEIGRRDGLVSMEGEIDSVRVYPRALTFKEATILGRNAVSGGSVLGGGSGGGSVGPAEDYLVAYWGLNESSGSTTADSSSNSNIGTLQNDASFVAGIEGNAISLDGANDHITIPSSPELEITNRITIMGWFYHSSTGGGTNVGIEKRGSYRLLAVERNAVSSKWNFSIKKPSGGFASLTTFGKYDNDSWHHVAGIYDGSTMKLYINGVLDRSINHSEPIPVTANNFEIGRRDGFAHYSGLIDEVKIFNRDLSELELKSMIADFNLSGFWSFEDSSGTTITDSSLYGNNGTLVGDAALGIGYINQGLVLDGSGDYVKVPSSTQLEMSNALSIVGWFKRSSSGGASTPGVLEKSGEYRILALGSAGATSTWRFDIRAADDSGWESLTTSSALPTDSWQHIAATYDGTIMRIYVNGLLDGTRSTTAGIKTGMGELSIGRRDSLGTFSGSIDELLIYKSVLSEEEIQFNRDL